MDITQVADVIRHLLNKTVARGCSEAEAMSAAAKVSALLQQYNLAMSEVNIEQSEYHTESVDCGRQNKHPIDGCIVGIANFCDCKVWRKVRDKTSYQFFGTATDTQLARFLYDTILCAIDHETLSFKKTETYRYGNRRKHLSTSFQKGMAHRIYYRLKEMADERKKNERTQRATGTNLVVVKDHKLNAEFKKLSLRLTNGQKNKSRISEAAFAQGKIAGDRVGLNKPLARQTAGLLT
jgi:hypothetical protein